MPPKVTMGKAAVPPSGGAAPPPAADGALIAHDSRGRTLEIKKLSLWEEMNLMAMAGGERSGNSRWMQYASVIACVRKIDGEFVSAPLTLRILESNIRLVGSEGFAAVVAALANDLPEGISDVASFDKDSAKN